MKKSNLFIALSFITIGVSCLVSALSSDTKLNGLLFAYAGACIMSGLVSAFKYFYWTSDKNKDKYAERLEQEQIELQDERKEKFRDKSGRYAYILGLGVVALSIAIIGVLESLEIISNSRFIIIYLFGYFIFQYVAGIIIFRYLNNKY